MEYDIESLKQGIEKAKVNIKTFEDVIANEYKTISEYRRMIEVVKSKQDED